MEIKDQAATPEQKAELKKLHNEEIKKVRIGGYVVAAVACIGATFLLKLSFFNFTGSYRKTFDNTLFAGACSFVVLIVSRFVQSQIAKGKMEKGLLYNLIQFTRLITFIIILFIFISFLNANWVLLCRHRSPR